MKLTVKPIDKENNFIYLFFALIIALFAAAVVEYFPDGLGFDIFAFVTLVMLVVSLKSLRTERSWKITVYFLITFFVILTALGKFFDSQVYIYLNLILLLVFYILAFASAYKQVLFVGAIDLNKIIGSMALYLLLGSIWAVIYLFILELDHTAFSGFEVATWQENFAQASYYSFVTLTTLGYGDILPVNSVAQFFVYLEAVIGVFYMAIIVSTLVSARHDYRETDDKKEKGD